MPKPPCGRCEAEGVAECPEHRCRACEGVGLLAGGYTGGTEALVGACWRCWGVQREPYYAEDGITIFHGDCREVLPLLQTQVDLVLTDPPYEAEAHTLQRRTKRGGGVMVPEPLPFDRIDEVTRRASSVLIAAAATRWVLTFCQVEASQTWRSVYEKAGLVYRRTCIWVKPDGMPQYSGDRPGMGYETFIAMHTPGRSYWAGGGRHGVFTLNKNVNGGRASLHPTEKPIMLIRELVELFSNPADLILDPFMGSGTTLRAAKDLGRYAIGIEIEEKYCEIAAKRMAQAVLPLAPRLVPEAPAKEQERML